MKHWRAIVVVALVAALAALAGNTQSQAAQTTYAYSCSFNVAGSATATLTIAGSVPATVNPGSKFKMTSITTSGSATNATFPQANANGTMDLSVSINGSNVDGDVTTTLNGIPITRTGSTYTWTNAVMPDVTLTAGATPGASLFKPAHVAGTAHILFGPITVNDGFSCDRSGAQDEAEFATTNVAGVTYSYDCTFDAAGPTTGTFTLTGTLPASVTSGSTFALTGILASGQFTNGLFSSAGPGTIDITIGLAATRTTGESSTTATVPIDNDGTTTYRMDNAALPDANFTSDGTTGEIAVSPTTVSGTAHVVVFTSPLDADFNCTRTPPATEGPFATTQAELPPPTGSLPKVKSSAVSVNEGTGGSRKATVVVELSSKPAQEVTVDYTTDGAGSTYKLTATKAAPGTASTDDHTPTSGVLTFPVGVKQQKIKIDITTDNVSEPNEAFNINFSNPKNATLKNETAKITIVDDDDVRVRVSDAKVNEGTSGTTALVFDVSLSNPSSSTVTLDIRTNDDTASSPSDYEAGSGQLIFNPGETTGTVTIFVNGDTVKEKNETFRLRLSPSGGGHITGASAQGTIRNDD